MAAPDQTPAPSDVADAGEVGDAETTMQGPPNPQGSGEMDLPSPPGSPMRSDVPSGTVAPGGPGTPTQPGVPRPVERPQREVVEPGSEVEPPPAVLTGADNAQSSQAEPSDDSGSE